MAEADNSPARRPRKARSRASADDNHLDTPDPIEIAMKAVAVGAVPGNAAQIVLEKHAHLIDVQCRREREELGNVRVQRITRWLMLGAVAAVLIALVVMLFNASQSRSLVIEPFDVPPALQQRGITGKVVSARLLDRLSDLQRQTESSRAESSYANNWEDQIQVAVPDTGISLGEVWRSLRRWLGQETRIAGEVVQTPTGLAITARAGSLGSGTIEGPETDLNRLLDESAAAIYRSTQPYRYAISLPPDRDSEREQVLLSLIDDPSLLERKWAYSGLSVTYRGRGDLLRAIAMAQQSLALDRDMFPAWANLGSAYLQLGHDEAALAAYAEAARSEHEGLHGEFDPRIVQGNLDIQRIYSRSRRGDALGAIQAAEALLHGTSRNFRLGAFAEAVSAHALAHDYRAMAQLASRASFTPEEAADYGWDDARAGALLRRAVDLNQPDMARAMIERLLAGADRAVEQELPATSALTSATSNTLAAPAARRRYAENVRLRGVWPFVSYALARTGRANQAAVLAARTPTDCYDCVTARAVAASGGGDRRGAERWFGEAIRQGPSIPMADHEWGLMLLGLGDLDGAAAHFERAHLIGPRWADPLKAWGDVLVRRGQWDEAEGRYREAAERAPRWGALHLGWARALWRIGRQDEAREKLRLAATMDLSAGDRSRLANMMRRAGI